MSFLHDKKEVERLIRLVADRILEDTTYQFVDKASGETLGDLKTVAPTKEVWLKSGYEDWKYWNGVTHIALFKMAHLLQDQKYEDYVLRNFDFIFENLDFFEKQFADFDPEQYAPNFHQFFRLDRLDDCGAMDGSLIEAYQIRKNDHWLDRLQKVKAWVSSGQDRLENGVFCRNYKGYTTVWADDVYMSVPFLVRMGKMSGDTSFWDDAITNALGFHELLFDDSKGLYWHSYCTQIGEKGVAHWGRANGWSIVAKCDLLEYIPKDYPGWEEVRKSLFEQIIGISRYQTANGMWRQLIDKPDSFLETSATAMFTYAVAKAVNEKWIPEIYSSIAINGWKGISENIMADGQITNISEGFNIRQDLSYYYNRPRPLNDPHGLGAVLLAGVEIHKMKDYQDYMWY
ncbi:Rhamnogalacturonyl hydrolase YesR [Zobellia uliginosa]|uniref:Rhamnogalacturonyl hydrolase YesR n=1 Tax=Zobellia uliginosa TaxID=143224 RepID=A0ABY1L532_9FLAO|nr:glycoside hydrolase family 88 protein [Zobellia uliginosa]SIT08657.1 Rhamnogalacturonyl hydrolase YesR [Zobellia uliginosa]